MLAEYTEVYLKYFARGIFSVSLNLSMTTDAPPAPKIKKMEPGDALFQAVSQALSI
uniref:Uncharacterized protein n=1 Tax=Anguilla anguilla TaxID=7936 RepID=A0A0E9UXK3_ANGAN